MDCAAQFSRASKAAAGIIRANAVVSHSLNRALYSTGNLKAHATVDVNVGFVPTVQSQQFGSAKSEEILFGSTVSQPVTRSDNRFSCSGQIRLLKSKQFKLPNQVTCEPVDTIQDLVDIKNNTDIVTIDVQNPYCDITEPFTSATEVKNGDIYAFATFFGTSMSAVVRAVGNFRNTYVDKIAGSFEKLRESTSFEAAQKLYPIKDITISKNNVSFVNKELKASGLHNSIDEGVYVGANYVINGRISNRISDDANTFIQPSSIYAEGDFTYKCEVSKPLITPIENFLFIRAAAPIFSYASEVPAEYKIHNIKFEDPSGNLIVKYKDINFRGDGDYRSEYLNNFATYITEPEINYAALNTWSQKYPIFGEASGYTLSMDFAVNCISTPFTEGFSQGYESDCKLDFVNSGTNDYLAIDGAPLSTRTQGYDLNPDNSIRISAIEISTKGFSAARSGLLHDNYLGFYTEVVPTGNRIERRIFPSRVLSPDFDNNIAPSANTVWKSVDVDNNIYDNTTESGIAFLTNNLRNIFSVGYIELESTSPIADSGKLKLRFDHEPPFALKQQTGGAFNFGARRRNKNFNSSSYDVVYANDAFFTVDSVELHVRARKAVGGRDYALDVVGYSDDGVINVTSSVGGFLQNIPGGSGQLPLYSGFNPIDDLGIASESISDKFQYFETTRTNAGGDHYLLTQAPVVSGTEFQTYIVPLKIYQDEVALGRSKDYTMSSYFEKLYVDIYPIPVGAAISRVDLIVKYKPINAMPLHTFGYEADELTQRTLKLFPSARKEKDNGLNAIVQNGPLSLIENIPQAYSNDKTLKTNYSRRWRGVDGNIFAGPFDPLNFSFAFENPQLEEPFLDGHFKFRNFDGNVILSNSTNESSDLSGIFQGYLNSSLIRNVGLRFKNQSLFPHSTPYTTLDWTTSGNALHGKIIDAFENAVRVSGSDGYIDFNNVALSSGFALFTRFVPDITITGSGYNLFNSGVIFSKWDAQEELEVALGYEDGYLCGYAKNSGLDLIKVKDTTYYGDYQYPLSVLLTYNDNNSHKLKLYTDNELASGTFNVLRDSSEEFVLHSGNSNLTFGYSHGSGVGINAFITEIGISTFNSSGTNIRESGFDSRLQQTTAESFLSSHRAKFWNTGEAYTNDRFSLWKYVDEDTDSWHLGAFKYCEFFNSFDILRTRVGTDYIVHTFKNTGTTYDQASNLPLPSNVITSGIAYHTQIENDMLRLNLGGLNDRFLTAAPRITKALPRGYSFDERGFVVETIIQHECTNDIVWPDGKSGPRLIVSLYTKSKDSDLFDTTNWGLVNRHIHYIAKDICWAKLSSTFNIDSLRDKETEPWSNFITDRNITELDHKYYSKDVNDMFVQYDLVYPSGNFESKIKLHAVHVKLENALLKSDIEDTNLHLMISGEKRERESLPLVVPNVIGILDAGMSLYAAGYIPETTNSIAMLYVDASVVHTDVMPLYGQSAGFIGVDNFSDNMNFGSDRLFGNTQTQPRRLGPTLFIAGRTDKYDDQNINLYLENDQRFRFSSAENNIVMFTHAGLINVNTSMTLYVDGGLDQTIPSLSVSAPLYVAAPVLDPIASSVIPFYIDCVNPNIITVSGSLGLYTLNYAAINSRVGQLESFYWNKDNVGRDIDVDDNSLAFLAANDEIRGVKTICYGDCDTTIGDTCKELEVKTHDTVWLPTACVDGGIFRALTTYTNPSVSGFKSPSGYDNHYYGIRKFVGLIPQAPYNITITAQTGSDGILEVPREISEWEYGTNNDVDYSGVKIVAGNLDRQANDEYGKSVAVKGDLIAIGAPRHSINDVDGYELKDAGAIFVYRRLPEPSGFDWTSQPDKSSWELETKLSLPDGFKRDYFDKVQTRVQNIDGTFIPFDVTETRWKVGQEGRQLGHTVSMAKTANREVIVAGGPSCMWTRTFDDVVTNKLSIGLIVFTDEFVPSDPNAIFDFVRYNELIYKYFCDPPISFDVKIAICEPVLGTEYDPSDDFADPKPDYAKKFRINRHTFYVRNSDVFRAKNSLIFNDIKDVFEDLFPYDTSKPNNNIPPMLGFYVDNSVSLGNRALQPALDQFITYYKEYSYASGLTNVFGNPASGIAHISLVTQKDLEMWRGDSEDWISQAAYLMSDTLDTGRLIENRQFTLFSNNLGTFNPNLPAFNIAPPSGGNVYIFEKEGEDWNIIQQITSPTTSNRVYPDHFGHAVTISDSGNIIVIGSPYINEAVQIYEYNPSATQYRNAVLPSWLNNAAAKDTGFGELYQLNQKYIRLVNSGIATASQQIYHEMSQSGKFEFMRQVNVPYYSLIKQYTYQDIDPQASWPWLVEKFAPTSRLGYSVATNSDGSIVAVGAPTDSMGAQDNAHIWWKPGFDSRTTQWQSYVNAGCIRLFEGRDYYPHSKAVEYGKFGNLHRLTNEQSQEDASYFDHFAAMFASRGVGFERTSFAETEIPQDAGTLFIITPAIDAASDEVIENLQNWLALGDRNLVLVGDDPIWEEDGLYAESNQIINYILERLDSRMRLHPARNKYEARIDDGLNINVVPSFVPAKTTPSYVRSAPLRGSGVADIRLHAPNTFNTYSCRKRPTVINAFSALDEFVPEYYDLNDKCEMPIIHEGDIRAKWNQILGANCRGGLVTGEYNLAMFFGTVSPVDWGVCPTFSTPTPATYQYEPTPILSAAEQVSRTVTYEAIPQQISYEQVGTLVGQTVGGAYPKFADFADSGVAFIWSSDSGNYLDLNTNIGQNTSRSAFFDPLEFNDKDALLMSRAEVRLETVNLSPEITKTFIYSTREQFEQTTSEVIVLAGTYTENKKVLLSSPNDANLNFYLNIVARDSDGSAKIAQLGGWTERNSFTAGYKESYLRNLFNALGNEVNENISTYDLSLIQNGYDVAWIANTDKLATDEDISRIKSWLSQGKKTLVITYGQNPLAENKSEYISDSYTLNAVKAAEDLLSRIGLQTRPLFLNSKNKYADKLDAKFAASVSGAYSININQSYAPIARGKRFGLVPSSEIFDFSLGSDGYLHDIIPLNGKNSTILADFSTPILDDSFVDRGIPLFKTGVAKVTFPVEPGSGYRIYFTVASETVNENELLDFRITNCSRNANFNPTERGSIEPIVDYNALNQPIALESPHIGASILKEYIRLPDGSTGIGRTGENAKYNISNFSGRPQVMPIDIQVPVTASSISIYIDGSNLRYLAKDAPDTGRTQRLIAISGALLPIETILTYQNVFRYDTVEKIIPAVPERSVTTQYFREIHTSSEKYCPNDGCRDNFLPVPEIADGPVVAAQEIYHQKPFNAGVNRSRITLISDASIIQGKSIALPDGNIINGLDAFLGSMYPFTSFPQQNGGRQYVYIRKIVSPERTSPQKLIAAYNNSGLALRFNGAGGGGGTSLSFSDLDNLINGGDRNYAGPLQPQIGRPQTYMVERDFPIIEPELIEAEKRGIISRFNTAQYSFGATAKFSGIIDGVAYADASVYGGMPQLMIDKGYDYLDFDKMPSGYPGDLFGYAVAIKDDKIFVGAPFAVFSGEDITTWTQVQQNTPTGPLHKAVVGFNGGAGAVYMFEKTNLGIGPLGANTPWSCTRKFRPNSINIGQDISNTGLSQTTIGSNTYSSQFLQHNSIISDKFGLSVSIDGDVLAISAPGHDFGTFSTETSGQFVRKEFNEQFHIPIRSNYDLGSASTRSEYIDSNTGILNIGAVYTYENKISNWGAKQQSWTLAQKLSPQGYKSAEQNASENSMFGQSISIDRTRRKDGDYTLVVGSPHHNYGNSGDATLNSAGASYTYDAMLRKLRPSFAHPDTFIAGRVFGDVTIEDPYTYFEFTNDYKYSERLYLNSVVFANNQGEIFLEASGQDKIPKGYITHRPFIEQIRGSFLFGTPSEYYTRLYVEGRPPEAFSTIPLINKASESSNVYNLLGLYNNAVLGIVSGIPSFNLYTSGNYVDIAEGSGMPLFVSGVELNSETLNLSIKGKF